MKLSIRPAYKFGYLVGFSLYSYEPIGKVYSNYKHAALMLGQVGSASTR